MSYSIHATGIDACDPTFIENRDAFLRGELSEKEQDELEINQWIIDNRRGAEIDIDNAVEETEDEYGGLIIDLEKIPREVTHILVVRG